MSQPRKHHYVPRFYLSGFTPSGSKDDQLYVLDKTSGRQWMSSPGNTACEKDFYLVDVEEDGDELAIEKLFSRVEEGAAEVVRYILKRKQLPQGGLLYAQLVEFMSIMAVRGPAVMRMIEEPAAKLARMQLIQATMTRERWERIERDTTKPGDPPSKVTWEEMRDFAQGDALKIDVAQGFKMTAMLKLLEVVPDLLAAREWTVVPTPDGGPQYICGDRPLTLSWDHPQEMVDYSPGLGLRGTSVAFPISKTLAIVGRFEGPLRTRGREARLVAITNMWTATQANNYVYSAQEDFDLVYRNGSVWNKAMLLKALAEDAAAQCAHKPVADAAEESDTLGHA